MAGRFKFPQLGSDGEENAQDGHSNNPDLPKVIENSNQDDNVFHPYQPQPQQQHVVSKAGLKNEEDERNLRTIDDMLQSSQLPSIAEWITGLLAEPTLREVFQPIFPNSPPSQLERHPSFGQTLAPAPYSRPPSDPKADYPDSYGRPSTTSSSGDSKRDLITQRPPHQSQNQQSDDRPTPQPTYLQRLQPKPRSTLANQLNQLPTMTSQPGSNFRIEYVEFPFEINKKQRRAADEPKMQRLDKRQSQIELILKFEDPTGLTQRQVYEVSVQVQRMKFKSLTQTNLFMEPFSLKWASRSCHFESTKGSDFDVLVKADLDSAYQVVDTNGKIINLYELSKARVNERNKFNVVIQVTFLDGSTTKKITRPFLIVGKPKHNLQSLVAGQKRVHKKTVDETTKKRNRDSQSSEELNIDLSR